MFMVDKRFETTIIEYKLCLVLCNDKSKEKGL